MSLAWIAAMVFTVALLVVTAYSLMGAGPLLILKHDTPMDSRFVRGFFFHYYRVMIVVASATAVSYALADRLVLAGGAGALALLALGLRRTVIARMDSLRSRIQLGDSDAVAAFRRLHVGAMLLNLAQLVTIVWALIALSSQLR
jgi:hypothetical protein